MPRNNVENPVSEEPISPLSEDEARKKVALELGLDENATQEEINGTYEKYESLTDEERQKMDDKEKVATVALEKEKETPDKIEELESQISEHFSKEDEKKEMTAEEKEVQQKKEELEKMLVKLETMEKTIEQVFTFGEMSPGELSEAYRKTKKEFDDLSERYGADEEAKEENGVYDPVDEIKSIFTKKAWV